MDSMWQTDSKVYMKEQKNQNSQYNIKGKKEKTWRTDNSATDGARTSGSTCKTLDPDTVFTHFTNINSKIGHTPKGKMQNSNPLEDNTGGNLDDFEFGDSVSDITQKACNLWSKHKGAIHEAGLLKN